MSCPGFLKSGNPRIVSCERCGYPAGSHSAVPRYMRNFSQIDTQDEKYAILEDDSQESIGFRPRNIQLERELTLTAARCTGLAGTGGLDDYADHRALPGGVRYNLDPIQETLDELADARNYLVWGLERVHDRMVAGESEASAAYERLMRCLVHVVAAWTALLTEAH